jgi:hypothetical protein
VPSANPQPETIAYRHFNLCPHCISCGEQSLLCRLCEGLPMISRTDGKTYHLLLADHPLPYPAERECAGHAKTSVCFWYSHIRNGMDTCSTVVLLPDRNQSFAALFRMIESVADLHAHQLSCTPGLPTFYELLNDSLVEVAR